MDVVPVVAGCLVSKDRKVLLGYREGSGSPETIGKWEMLGGRVEPDESLKQALVRELKEETGYMVEVVDLLHAQLNTYSDNVPYLVLYYYCRILCRVGSGEGKELKWVYPNSEEFKNALHGTNEALGKLIAGGKY